MGRVNQKTTDENPEEIRNQITMKRIILTLLVALNILNLSADNTRYVNMFLGSAGDHGQLPPGATVPFGMVSVCPDSDPNQHGGYDYNVERISGISINRISGCGCYGVGGNVRILPADQHEEVRIIKGSEKAYPGYYETDFSNGIKGCFTATKNMAVESYELPEGEHHRFFIDFASCFDRRKNSAGYKVIDENTIEGWTISPTACARGVYKMYFVIHTDKPYEIVDSQEEAAVIEFKDNVKKVEIRVAVSTVDQASAYDALEAWNGMSFSKILKSAVKQWKEVLDKINVKGGDKESKILFYTFLYRTYLSPMDVTSEDGRYYGTDKNIHQADGFTFYTSWSMWDTFRTKFPLLTILEPEKSCDFATSLLHLYRTGKRDWVAKHEAGPTVRNEHSVVMIWDAYSKGLGDIDLNIGYKKMKSEAEKRLPMKSLDQKLESCYDLWAFSQIAAAMGQKEDAELFMKKSEDLFAEVWKGHFMEITPDFHIMKANGLYQGTKWQYRWAMPGYMDKMIEWVGKEKLADELEQFFAEDHYNQGNEPDIHTPFLFNVLGRPEMAQKVVRKFLTDDTAVHRYGGNAEYPEPYIGRAFKNSVDGLAFEMDEDDGTMSAWYIFSTMGFYPVVVGSNEYELISPLFDKITIKSGDSRFTIKTKHRKSQDDIIKTISVDGKPLERWSITHDMIRNGSTVEIGY